jgi:hypothetical protein
MIQTISDFGSPFSWAKSLASGSYKAAKAMSSRAVGGIKNRINNVRARVTLGKERYGLYRDLSNEGKEIYNTLFRNSRGKSYEKNMERFFERHGKTVFTDKEEYASEMGRRRYERYLRQGEVAESQKSEFIEKSRNRILDNLKETSGEGAASIEDNGLFFADPSNRLAVLHESLEFCIVLD